MASKKKTWSWTGALATLAAIAAIIGTAWVIAPRVYVAVKRWKDPDDDVSLGKALLQEAGVQESTRIGGGGTRQDDGSWDTYEIGT